MERLPKPWPAYHWEACAEILVPPKTAARRGAFQLV